MINSTKIIENNKYGSQCDPLTNLVLESAFSIYENVKNNHTGNLGRPNMALEVALFHIWERYSITSKSHHETMHQKAIADAKEIVLQFPSSTQSNKDRFDMYVLIFAEASAKDYYEFRNTYWQSCSMIAEPPSKNPTRNSAAPKSHVKLETKASPILLKPSQEGDGTIENKLIENDPDMPPLDYSGVDLMNYDAVSAAIASWRYQNLSLKLQRKYNENNARVTKPLKPAIKEAQSLIQNKPVKGLQVSNPTLTVDRKPEPQWRVRNNQKQTPVSKINLSNSIVPF
jgi:hypothetical protein